VPGLRRTTAYAFCLALLCRASGQAPMRISPLIVRQAALQAPLPLYPESSLKDKHHGVAVAEVSINLSGVPVDIKILQAPDKAIADSVTATLRAWRFRQYRSDTKTAFIQTRLIFYFDLAGPSPHVTDALHSPYD
jgi:outer membrane biosynthesis protein TonB